jgi:hypothetical protein
MWSGAQLSNNLYDGFRNGLRDAGWIEGQNLILDERTYGPAGLEHIPEMTAQLVATKPDILFAGNDSIAQAFMRASDSIPIVALPSPIRSASDWSGAMAGQAATSRERSGHLTFPGVRNCSICCVNSGRASREWRSSPSSGVHLE